ERVGRQVELLVGQKLVEALRQQERHVVTALGQPGGGPHERTDAAEVPHPGEEAARHHTIAISKWAGRLSRPGNGLPFFERNSHASTSVGWGNSPLSAPASGSRTSRPIVNAEHPPTRRSA